MVKVGVWVWAYLVAPVFIANWMLGRQLKTVSA